MARRGELRQVWYPALILLLLLSLYAYTHFSAYSDFSLNLATEIIGILLTIILVDRVLRRQHEREMEEYQRVALRRLKLPLLHHVQLFQSIYKASVQQPPGREFVSLEEFVSDNGIYLELTRFDVQKDAPVTPKRSWRDYLIQEVNEFKDKLNTVADKYAAYMQPELLDMIEEVTSTWFISWVALRPAMEQSDRQMGLHIQRPMFPVVTSDGVEKPAEMVREHMEKLLMLVNYYNERASDKDKVTFNSDMWRKDISPQIGSARLEL